MVISWSLNGILEEDSITELINLTPNFGRRQQGAEIQQEIITAVQITTAAQIVLGTASPSLGTLVILLWAPSSSKEPRSILDENGKVLEGSISEKCHVLINGVQQGMFITGRNIDNPVLLFIHGGTPRPSAFSNKSVCSGLEEHIAVCWWERRGAGLWHSANIPPETITLDQWISDTVKVTKHLHNHFSKEKIFLMVHSGGTVIGIQATAQALELCATCVGAGQNLTSTQIRGIVM